MKRGAPFPGPQRALVTSTWPPLELSQRIGSQQMGSSYLVGVGMSLSQALRAYCERATGSLGLALISRPSGYRRVSSRCADGTMPMNEPGFTRFSFEEGIQCP